ncbi:hypothetical protein COJ85_27785 [Bacillus sp. AFS076308]|uniref:hypothetical protein n=1 Tax=Bacillus sp. AFS076308 TaxID=2033512 RepID=UPI000BF4D955|nr:hypothetical protein [Bacillus sp. AFS076308]PFN83307.1 hypothetical protein COJ85_27785 [Bacillus sp. AFS076308]
MLKSSNIKFTGDIHIQTMQRQSGIFIGERNVAIGWSAHGKENSVIGNISGQSNLLLHNISILNDPDLVDTPIDDRDINISFENPGDTNTTNLTMESLNVNKLEQNSSVFLGKAHVNGMDSNQKGNSSQGTVNGNKNQLLNNLNINNDQDFIDAIIDDRDTKIAKIDKEN